MGKIGDTFKECDICGHVYDINNHETCPECKQEEESNDLHNQIMNEIRFDECGDRD
jgi:rubredoxin